MASYVLDEFLGAGLLKNMGRIFAADGWDDVPTLKVISAEDMEALDLTDTQRDALELRIYLHNRSLMKYADRMEASRIGLTNLMSMKPSELASKFKMRKTHVATFVDTALVCGIQMPPDLSRMSSARRRSPIDSYPSEDARAVPYFELVKQRPLYKPPPFELHKSTLSDASSLGSPRSPPRKSSAGEWGFKRFYAKNSPPRKSNAVEPPRMSNVVEPPRKSNAGEWESRNFHAKNSPPRKSNAGEPPRMSNVVEPPRKSNVVEPPRKSNVVEPPRKSNAGVPPRKSNAGEWGSGNFHAKNSPPRKSNAGLPPRKSNAVEPPRMSNVVEPPRKSNAGEWGSGNFRVKDLPPRKSNAGEPPRMSNVVEPPRKSNAGEWGSENFRVKDLPPRKSNAGEPPRMSNVVEPPRKSNAGEWGSGNFRAKDSPPRKSSAGELGFRNFYAKNSPPRKSDAGFYEYACARSSPPRKSNVGELGFNGNPFARNSPPRKSNAGELGFSGNPFVRNSPPRKSNAGDFGNSVARNSPPRKSNAGQLGFEQPSWVRPADATKPNALKGVFSATSTKRQLCGMVKAPSSDKVAKIALLEKVLVRQLAPEHSYGVDSRSLRGSRKFQPFKASNLWSDKATLFFCIRRPGCVMCRAEAHQLFARKPIFDALGIQLVAVLLEDIDEEVWAFWPRYWAGMVVLDEKRDFFRALGGGKLMKDNLFTGFFLNPIARLNWKRAMKTGIQYNTRGEGQIKGGMFIIRPGKGGVAYQFAEKNFGDWAPLDEVLQVCHLIREEGDCDSY